MLVYCSLSLLQSCSNYSINDKDSSDAKNPLSVDLNEEIVASHNSPVIKKDDAAKTVGPVPVETYNVTDKNMKSEINTLLLGPGIYRSFGYLPILKKIKSEKVPIHIIGGYGISSVIATYFAFGYEPDLIEWKLFTNLIKSSKPYPFSDKWLYSVFTMLEKDFSGKNIEDSKISLFIPEYRNNELNFATRGNILTKLKSNLLLNKSGSLSTLIGSKICEKKGASRILQSSKMICLNVLDLDLKWLSAKDYILGVFNKASSSIMMGPAENKIDLNLEGIEIDNLSTQPEVLTRSKKQADEIIMKINEQINYKL